MTATINLNPQDAIEEAVYQWAASSEYDDLEKLLSDLAQHGCESGMVGDLIYYSDTCKFYEEHRALISEMLKDAINDGLIESPANLKDWDETDPLALEETNQNLLAWWAFETAAYNLASRADLM